MATRVRHAPTMPHPLHTPLQLTSSVQSVHLLIHPVIAVRAVEPHLRHARTVAPHGGSVCRVGKVERKVAIVFVRLATARRAKNVPHS